MPARLAPRPEGARTTIIVRLGLLVLTVVGALAIFGEALFGPGGPTTDLGNTSPRGNVSSPTP